MYVGVRYVTIIIIIILYRSMVAPGQTEAIYCNAQLGLHVNAEDIIAYWLLPLQCIEFHTMKVISSPLHVYVCIYHTANICNYTMSCN